MKLSLNWLKDYVTLPEITAEELLSKVSLSVCEMESCVVVGDCLKKIVVSEVLEINPHPNADRLTLVKVSTGKEMFEVVCGAKNFSVGDKVPYAPLGTALIDFTVKKAKIRGVESCGVLCAEDEIGFGEDHSGLMLLDKKEKLGKPLAEIYPDQLDTILDLDNKSINHRPDLWGHYGFARELSVLFGVSFKEFSPTQNIKGKTKSNFSISVECKDLVPRFSALDIEGLQICPSPDWLKFRLHRVGLRAISNLVDVTNYVMLDLGQPMHIFDKERLSSSQLVVRKAKAKEKLTTLKEKEIELCEEDICISDGKKPVSLAGVMGGLNSGIQENTKNTLLEAACWDASTIRKTAARTKQRTDASQRFEKSLDPTLTSLGIYKAVEILKISNPNLEIKGELIDIASPEITPQPQEQTIEFQPKDCDRILGVSVPKEKMKEILLGLGFKIEEKNERWRVKVPSWRATRDVAIAEDLIEEIGRFYGYDKIKAEAPVFPVLHPEINQQRKLERKAKQILVDRGYFETFSYPLSSEEREKEWSIPNLKQGKMLINPTSEEETRMRLSLLPQVCDAVSLNTKEYSHFRFFELGRIYTWDDAISSTRQPQEENIFFWAAYDEKISLGELFESVKTDLFIWLAKLLQKSCVLKPLAQKPLKAEQTNLKAESDFHPYANAEILIEPKNYLNKNYSQKIGRIFSFTPLKRKQLGWDGNAVFIELNFDLVFQRVKRSSQNMFVEPNKYPPAKFEISLVVPIRTYFSELEVIAKKIEILEKIEFQYDYFLPEQPDKKSVTLAMTFRSKEQTVDSERLTKIQDSIVASFEEKGFMLRR